MSPRPSRRGRAAPWRGAVAAVALIGVAAGVWFAAPPLRAVMDRDAGREQGPAAAAPEPVPPHAQATPPGAGLPLAATPRARPPAPHAAGLVAVIFDDAGATLAQLDPILALGREVTVAVLPGLAASPEVSWRARRAGLQVILHLPVEAEETARALGPGGVTTSMDDEAIAAQVRADLEGVPGALGLSPHMGSRGTADRRVMAAVLGVVRERGLFFVDNRTTAQTVAASLAREMGIPVAERAVFLDNLDDPAYIAAQVRLLLEVARAQGSAVGIGHVQKQTAQVLAGLLPEFDRARIVFVPVSMLAR